MSDGRSSVDSEPAIIILQEEEPKQAINAIEQHLSPDEAKAVRDLLATMRPEQIPTWKARIVAMSPKEAAAHVRERLRERKKAPMIAAPVNHLSKLPTRQFTMRSTQWLRFFISKLPTRQ